MDDKKQICGNMKIETAEPAGRRIGGFLGSPLGLLRAIFGKSKPRQPAAESENLKQKSGGALGRRAKEPVKPKKPKQRYDCEWVDEMEELDAIMED